MGQSTVRTAESDRIPGRSLLLATLVGGAASLFSVVALGMLVGYLLSPMRPKEPRIPEAWQLGPGYSAESIMAALPVFLFFGLAWHVLMATCISAVMWLVFRRSRVLIADWLLVGVGFGLLAGAQMYMGTMARPSRTPLDAISDGLVELVAFVLAALAMGLVVKNRERLARARQSRRGVAA